MFSTEISEFLVSIKLSIYQTQFNTLNFSLNSLKNEEKRKKEAEEVWECIISFRLPFAC